MIEWSPVPFEKSSGWLVGFLPIGEIAEAVDSRSSCAPNGCNTRRSQVKSLRTTSFCKHVEITRRLRLWTPRSLVLFPRFTRTRIFFSESYFGAVFEIFSYITRKTIITKTLLIPYSLTIIVHQWLLYVHNQPNQSVLRRYSRVYVRHKEMSRSILFDPFPTQPSGFWFLGYRICVHVFFFSSYISYPGAQSIAHLFWVLLFETFTMLRRVQRPERVDAILIA